MRHSAGLDPAPTDPDFDPFAIADYVCQEQGWERGMLFVYTGLLDEDQVKETFWTNLGLSREIIDRTLPFRKKSRDFWIAQKSKFGRRKGEIQCHWGTIAFRKTKARCVSCDSYVGLCPECEADYRNVHEVGIDVRLAIDVVYESELADVIVLFSSDQDFSVIPDRIKSAGRKVPKFCCLAIGQPTADNAESDAEGSFNPSQGIKNYHKIEIPVETLNGLRISKEAKK